MDWLWEYFRSIWFEPLITDTFSVWFVEEIDNTLRTIVESVTDLLE